jgi:hypothetical protein
MAMVLSNITIGNWDEILKAIRVSDDFMFNYYLKSRDRTEIQKRVDSLVKVLEREVRIYLTHSTPLKIKQTRMTSFCIESAMQIQILLI